MSNILIVDTSREDAENYKKVLQQQDHEVRLSLAGEDAGSLLMDKNSAFDLAIVLWEMPGLVSGFDLLSRCRSVRPKMPVVVLTGTLDATLATRAFALGARDFLEKPVTTKRLSSCVTALVGGAETVSPLLEKIRADLLGSSEPFIKTIKEVARVIKDPDLRVLIVGESGTGKELLAKAIHQHGPHSKQPWAAVNVGEIAPTLVEAALFGHEAGAFTDARKPHVGYLEEAGEGTLFLDEIGDLDKTLQVKLLRVLQEKQFRRIGGKDVKPFDARVVCATNRDLTDDVTQGIFRKDLFHRIAEATVHVPPLRERPGDVKLLAERFLEHFAKILPPLSQQTPLLPQRQKSLLGRRFFLLQIFP